MKQPSSTVNSLYLKGVLTMFALCVVLIFATPNVSAQSVDIAPVNLNVNEQSNFFVSINIEDVVGFKALDFKIDYNDVYLSFDKILLGPAMTLDCVSPMQGYAEIDSDTIYIHVDREECGGLNVVDPSTAVYVYFNAQSTSGTSSLVFTDNTVYSNEGIVIANWNNAEVTVESLTTIPAISILPASGNIVVGNNYEFTINVTDVQDLASIILDIPYDNTRLTFVSAQAEGPFADDLEYDFFFVSEDLPGVLSVMGDTSSLPFTGDSLLATIIFTTINTGTANVTFDKHEFNGIYDAFYTELAANYNNAEVIVGLPATPAISILPASGNIVVGNNYEFTINVTDVQDLASIILDIPYDNTRLTFVSAQAEGPFADDLVNDFFSVDEMTPGLLSVMGDTSSLPFIGDSLLATIIFTTINTGTANVTFDKHEFNGIYDAFYTELAANYNNAQVTVESLPDTTSPIITITGENPLEIMVGGTYSELGATANDDTDGDISGIIVIDATNVNTSTVGSYTVTYNVVDSAGNNASEVTRTVNVVALPDTESPVITLTGDNPQELTINTVYTELGAVATDDVDGDISSSIIIDASAVDMTTLGSYTVTYNAVDSSGNHATEVTRTVTVIAEPLVITNIAHSGISKSGATVTWTTNLPSTSKVEYGTSVAYGLETAVNAATTTTHTVSLTSLFASTVYHYRVISSIDGQTTTSTNATFTTSAASTGGGGGTSGGGGGGYVPSQPVVETVSTEPIESLTSVRTESSVTLNWENPADNDFSKVVIVRSGTSLGTSIVLDAAKDFAEVVYEGSGETFTDNNLNPNLDYYYLVYTIDKKGRSDLPEIIKIAKKVSTSTGKEPAPTTTPTKLGKNGLFKADSSVVEQVTQEEAQVIIQVRSRVNLDAVTIPIYERVIRNKKLTNEDVKYQIAYFIHHGTETTQALGAGERGGVLDSYYSSFAKMPFTENEWKDVLKIANGRWPSERNVSLEDKNKKEVFSQIYKRAANMDTPNDNAAVTVISYGLRPLNRNMESEKTAIKFFRAIFNHNPANASDWDIVRAIAYSGAIR